MHHNTKTQVSQKKLQEASDDKASARSPWLKFACFSDADATARMIPCHHSAVIQVRRQYHMVDSTGRYADYIDTWNQHKYPEFSPLNTDLYPSIACIHEYPATVQNLLTHSKSYQHELPMATTSTSATRTMSSMANATAVSTSK